MLDLKAPVAVTTPVASALSDGPALVSLLFNGYSTTSVSAAVLPAFGSANVPTTNVLCVAVRLSDMAPPGGAVEPGGAVYSATAGITNRKPCDWLGYSVLFPCTSRMCARSKTVRAAAPVTGSAPVT